MAIAVLLAVLADPAHDDTPEQFHLPQHDSRTNTSHSCAALPMRARI